MPKTQTKQTKQVELQIKLFLIEAFSDYATERQTRKKFSNMSDVVEKHSNRLLEIVSQAQQEAREDERERILKELDKTYTGCACGLHGYQVLPDCDEKEHGSRCADCVIKALQKEQE